MAEDTIKDRFNHFWNTHRRVCVVAIAAVIVAGVYIFAGQELGVDSLADRICQVIGGC